jgi:hypothetical protein
MWRWHRVLLSLAVVVPVLACDSVELTIGVDPGPGEVLLVSNANSSEWTGAQLLVEAVENDNSTTVCVDKRVGTWRPGDVIEVPRCGEKLRFTLSTGGETARFAYANGQLFRRFGRKEVPVAE